MKMKKINLGKLHISSLSERELNNVFGGVSPTTTAPAVTNSANGYTQSSTHDQDVVGDSDVEVIEEIINF
jgi:natural product precursor